MTDPTPLRRVLSTPLVTLYGLGVTIGAGIYVLVGVVASMAGPYAPVSFLISALVVAFVALCYAEFAVRFPVSAGEAAYVKAGFGSNTVSVVIGLMVAATGVVSAAAIAIGAADYLIVWLANIFDAPPALVVAAIVLVLGLAAIKGIAESVAVAALFTLIEIGGLVFAVWAGTSRHPEILGKLGELIPPLTGGDVAAAWGGVFATSLIAFFAFVGFEDIVNVAEEVKRPERTLPRAILLTLLVSTLLYVAVVAVVALALPAEVVGGDTPALVLLFGDDAGARSLFNAVAVFATLNGVLIQMIMASRILYGLAAQGGITGAVGRHLATVNPRTRTPIRATLLVVAIILALTLTLPIVELAQWSSRIILTTFAIVSAALIVVKVRERKRGQPAPPAFCVPISVPTIAVVAALFLLVTGSL